MLMEFDPGSRSDAERAALAPISTGEAMDFTNAGLNGGQIKAVFHHNLPSTILSADMAYRQEEH